MTTDNILVHEHRLVFTNKINRSLSKSSSLIWYRLLDRKYVNLRNAGGTYKVTPVGQGRVKHHQSERENL